MKISNIDFLPAIQYQIVKTDNRSQIISLYQNYLIRTPTESEITKYIGRSNDEIINELTVSDEYIQLQAEKAVTMPVLPVPAGTPVFGQVKPIGWGLIATAVTWALTLF